MTDAETVLRWMGYEPVNENRQLWQRPKVDLISIYDLDANWIMATLVPALAEAGLRAVINAPGVVAPFEVQIRPEPREWVLAETFEAAFLAAAAKAVSDDR